MDSNPSAESTIDPSELGTVLARVGLGQYEECLRENGFENWETVMVITETDMMELGFRLGDRRKLQRAIQDGSSSGLVPVNNGTGNPPVLPEGLSDTVQPSEVIPRFSKQATRTTRQYRRHPQPDPHAPLRPKTAYVLFGEHVRQNLTSSRSSFVDIAKETGRRWRELPNEERAGTWERPAADRLQEYKEELGRYKQTEHYQGYRTDVEVFEQRQHNSESTTLSDNKPSSTSKPASFSRLPARQSQDDFEANLQESVDTEDLKLDLQLQETTSPVKCGMDEVRHILKALAINSHLIRVAALPPEDMTAKAVQAFVHGTGSLLYLWNQTETSNLVRSVYRPQSGSRLADTTEIFAMSAVGSYCDGGAHTVLLQEKFLHLFLHMLVLHVDISNFHRMRLFTCLAICRFASSAESARRLMLSAINIGRHAFTSQTFRAETSEEDKCHWWGVFRSVVFLESWFAYNTGHGSRITEQDLTLYQPSSLRGAYGSETLQERVSQLGQLSAYAALSLKTDAQPKVVQAQSHIESLNKWHRTLPLPMQLSRLSLADPLTIDWHSKRSLLQFHILFLGLFLEPYRKCLLDLAAFRLGRTSIRAEDLKTFSIVEEQCVLAARQCARVVSLLQIDDSIRSRCWVSVYTSYTGCAILLFSASQKLLELLGEEIGQDLAYASSHLSVLSLCSYDNPSARRLHIPLQVIYNDIREVVVSPVYRRMRELHIVVKDAAYLPPSHYDSVEGAEAVSKTILDLTRRIIDTLKERLNF